VSLKSRLAKLEKHKPPQTITLSQAIEANDAATTEAFLAQHNIAVDPAAVVHDKVERELERLIAEAEGRRRLPNGLKLLTPEAQVNEGPTDDLETDTCT
jgi:hypothetical protein